MLIASWFVLVRCYGLAVFPVFWQPCGRIFCKVPFSGAILEAGGMAAMKKSVHRAILMVLTCAVIIVGLLVAASLINSKATAVRQAERSLSYMCETYAGEFNLIFSDSELLVNTLAAALEREYIVEEYIDDRAVFERMKQKTSELIQKAIGNSAYPIGLYVTFAPESSKGKDEIWYVKNENGEVSYIDSVPISDSWLADNDTTTAYYFHTIENGALWLDAEYDPGMDGDTVTYAKALYDRNGALIGVIGTDILVEDIYNSLDGISREIGGYASFIDSRGELMAGASPQKYAGAEQYIHARADVGARGVLVLAQPMDSAVGSILRTEAAVILLGILMIITAVFLVAYYSRKHMRPMIHEAELKDAVLIHQARQAKLGEMVGNIAHQWKQPLNSMKMALSNMQDDYDQKQLDADGFGNYIYRMKLMVDHLAVTADDFTAFLRPAKKPSHFSVGREIERVIDLMDERLRLCGIAVVVEGPEIHLEGYRNEFDQCIFNLFDNACDALLSEQAGNRRIVVTTAVERMPSGKAIYTVKIYNNGKHIDAGMQDKIFDLYFTTKDEAEGTGIGLYLTRDILRRHFNGDISVENVDGGVLFQIKVVEESGK